MCNFSDNRGQGVVDMIAIFSTNWDAFLLQELLGDFSNHSYFVLEIEDWWTTYFDGSSTKVARGIGLVIIDPIESNFVLSFKMIFFAPTMRQSMKQQLLDYLQ